MRPSVALGASAVGLTAILIFACTADPPPINQYDRGFQDTWHRPDLPPNCLTGPALDPPLLDSPPALTSYTVQAFRGTCFGAERMTAVSGAGNAAPVLVAADGKFCIEVQLLPDSPNRVAFAGIDHNGCLGRETLLNITHNTAPSADGGISAPINLARNASVSSDPKPEAGELSYVNDGDSGSSAQFSFFDTGAGSFAWVRLDLGKVYTISRVKIRWAADAGSDYATTYAVLLSAQPGPGEPSTANGAWKVVKQVSTGDATEQILPLNPEQARWAALLMYENAATWPYETFKLAELEVIGQDPDATPPPPPDHCQ